MMRCREGWEVGRGGGGGGKGVKRQERGIIDEGGRDGEKT